MKALRSVIFSSIRKMMAIEDIPDDEVPGTQVSLSQALVWSIRELRLHSCAEQNLEVHLKLDGRPMFGNFFRSELCITIKFSVIIPAIH